MAGVLQGASSSTALFLAYTNDIVDFFNQHFAQEIFIHVYHILLHADDALILATSREKFEEKFKTMYDYCKKNFIEMEPKKCGVIVIKSAKLFLNIPCYASLSYRFNII